MGKIDYINEGRAEGLKMAYKLVKDGGIEELEKELRFRNITGINTKMTSKELDEASTSIKNNMMHTLLIMMIAVLHDEFGFGETRCKRAMGMFWDGVYHLENGYAEWNDYIEAIKEELKMDLSFVWERPKRIFKG